MGNKNFALLSVWLTLNLYQISCVAQSPGWTQFRGTNLDGISTEKNVPVQWSDSTNILWKTAIRGKGWSSPVVLGDQVWVTTASEDGKEMAAVRLDFETGKILFDQPVFRQDSLYRKHPINTYATPTPALEEEFVYVNFGSTGTACLSTNYGAVVWKRTDFKVAHVQGPGSSPVLFKDLLILHFEGTDKQIIVALNKNSGETIWQTERPSECYESLQPIGKKAYITPIFISVSGKDLMISNGAAVCNAYDVQTGKEVWRLVQGEDSTIPMPVYEDGVIYFYTSFVTPKEGEKYAELLAVNPVGTGDITSKNVLWRHKTPELQILTPLVKDGLIYTVDSKNLLTVLDAKTGEVLYSKKLSSKYNASPVYADGKVFFSSIKGETLVLKAGRQYSELASNKLKGEIFASPAIAGSSLLIRTESSLYRITEK
jgi:outer membrane protein assembly factor BamB